MALIRIDSFVVFFLLSDGTFCPLQIIDTVGKERYRGLYLPYLNKSNIIIIIYNITNKYAFDEVSNYYKNVIKYKCNKNQRVILLGNKADLEEEREVSFEEGKSLAKLYNYIFMEVSCIKNENIKKSMEIAISFGLKELNNQNHLNTQEKKACSII